MAKKKFYVVWEGRKVGVFDNWNECKKQIHNFSQAKYKSFEIREIANSAFIDGYKKHWGLNKKSKKSISDVPKKNIGFPINESISVDGACEGNPGIAEYQGVNTKTKLKIFHGGPFPEGTNNIMEFLALVHALSYCKKENLKTPIYSDSKIAISWIRDKRLNTSLKKSDKNKKLFELMDRALKWLYENEYENQILKWETKAWGENPADFGRK